MTQQELAMLEKLTNLHFHGPSGECLAYGLCGQKICTCPATSEFDAPCAKHGIRPIGMRSDGSFAPNEFE